MRTTAGGVGRRARWLIAVVAIAGAGVGCVRHPGTPAFDTDDYEAKVVLTAEAAGSNVATVGLGLDAEAAGHTTARYLEVLVSDQEVRLEETVGSFGAVDPPTAAAREMRATLIPILTEAQDTIATVRIELDAGHPDRALAQREDLDEIGRQLQRLAEP